MNKNILKKMGMEKEVERVEMGFCPTCNEKINPDDFCDALSLREFRISGMCQECQDSVFNKGGE